ncbi:MAG: hypothetical protein AB1602_01455 [Elusimicrobiota bacterium]
MKKGMLAALMFVSINSYSYFDGGINYVTGKDGYQGQDIYMIIGKNNWWLRPEYSTWKTDTTQRINKFSTRLGFEKETYTLAFEGGFTPENNSYKNVMLGGDITFSLNPTSSSKRRIAGPNSGFVSRGAKGVTQIDLGAGARIVAHTYTASDTDLRELDTFLFAGAKVFLTQLSVNYTVYTYDKESLAKTQAPGNNKAYGMNSYFPVFLKSNFNFKVEIPGSPMVTPYISYNKLKSKSDDSLNVYAFGGYIDLAMIGVTAQFETYKGDMTNDKRYNYLSVSAGLRF